MEHVKVTLQAGKQMKLTAEKGWLLKSKVTGKTYNEIDTCDKNRWLVVEDTAIDNLVVDVPKPKRRRRKDV